MRIASWNVNSLTAERVDRIVGWVRGAQPDVLCLQETKCSDDAFPALEFHGLGYASVHHGQGRWNGVAILSRVGLEDPVSGFADGGPQDPEARLVSATCGGVRVSSVYVPNGRVVGSEHFAHKLDWLARLRAHVEAELGDGRPAAVCGDFNVAPADIDLYDPAQYVGSTHVTPEERGAIADLEAWGLHDVFRRIYPGVPKLFSWWDYRAGMFAKHKGMRIDLLMLSDDLASRATYALIDRSARKGKKPSDHAPLYVDVDVDAATGADVDATPAVG